MFTLRRRENFTGLGCFSTKDVRCVAMDAFDIIIFIGVHTFALMDTDSTKICFMRKDACYGWSRVV